MANRAQRMPVKQNNFVLKSPEIKRIGYWTSLITTIFWILSQVFYLVEKISNKQMEILI